MVDQVVQEGELLWEPSSEFREHSNIAAYLAFLKREKNLDFTNYPALWQWSVDNLDAFWQSICDHYAVTFHAPYTSVHSGQMPDVHWFEGSTLNYAEHALRRRDKHAAVVARAEDGSRNELDYAALAEQVARVRCGLKKLGVGKGDRVAALLPNRIEALVAFLATASLGAVWSSCSPEFGVGSVLDRFTQIQPKVLIAVDAYTYGGKRFERRAELTATVAGLRTLEKLVLVGGHTAHFAHSMSFTDLAHDHEPLTFEAVPFEHPLWILYSSGTTGLPKPIVQGHGGILLEHFKALGLHCDIKQDDHFFWFTTTGWMMWNFLVSGLLLGCTIVLYDGSPAHPHLYALWKVAEEERISYFGTSAPFLLACKKAGTGPSTRHDLSKLRSIGTTGAPLPADGFGWVYQHVSKNVLLGSVSGGTDVCTAFVISCPLLPVHAGEIQCRGLGAKIEAFDEGGKAVVDRVGELVLTEPLPSMPIYFWNDPDGARFKESYFSMYPGVWRHGDWIKITPRGSCVIYGRSDSTLNRGGVRMGTSEFYRVVESVPEVSDSLVVDTGSMDDASGKLWLFVVLRPGAVLDDTLRRSIAAKLKTELSPRHVPDEVRQIHEVPRTLNGKKLEVPIKRILLGTSAEKAASAGTLANPQAIQTFVELRKTLEVA
jgi:acetoacetyl-CoA synthetase